jgi:hypothetical protein
MSRLCEYLERNHSVWSHFFADHYRHTHELRQTDPSAFPPLLGYVIEDNQDGVEQAEEEEDEDEDNGEPAKPKKRGSKKATPRKPALKKRVLEEENEDDAGVTIPKKRSPKKATPKNLTSKKKATPKETTPKKKATPKKTAVDNPNVDQEQAFHDVFSCPEQDCAICNMFMVELDFEPDVEIDPESLAHTVECPGADCEKCNAEAQEQHKFWKELEASQPQADSHPIISLT